VQQLCEKASAEVAEGQGVRIANFLCPGNYAVSGGLDGCAVVEKIAKPDFKVGNNFSAAGRWNMTATAAGGTRRPQPCAAGSHRSRMLSSPNPREKDPSHLVYSW
jgi:hypothetical protein